MSRLIVGEICDEDFTSDKILNFDIWRFQILCEPHYQTTPTHLNVTHNGERINYS